MPGFGLALLGALLAAGASFLQCAAISAKKPAARSTERVTPSWARACCSSPSPACSASRAKPAASRACVRGHARAAVDNLHPRRLHLRNWIARSNAVGLIGGLGDDFLLPANSSHREAALCCCSADAAQVHRQPLIAHCLTAPERCLDGAAGVPYTPTGIKSWADAHANLPFPGKVDRESGCGSL